MQKINDILKKYEIRPNRYEKKGKVWVVDADSRKYVLKKNNHLNPMILEYLKTRSFDYYPIILSDIEDEYCLTPYLEDSMIPREQKMLDMIDLVALLHNKTTHFKEITEDDYKEIYEDVVNNIAYLTSYYQDIITIIESKVYMSPSQYMLARNISKLFAALSYCQYEIEEWYKLVKEKRKQRFVVLHNHLELDHFIRNDHSYLISWDKAKIGIPVFDIFKLYKKHALEFDFGSIMNRYEKHYPLLEEERKLFFILIALPDIITFDQDEYEMCKMINDKIDMLYKTDLFLSPHYSKKAEQD